MFNILNVFNTLFPANFKGVPFLMDGSDLSAGRKVIIHEFPNKDFRYVEDMGKNLRTYTIRGVISANDGITYRILRNQLQEAFDSANPGIFLHPMDGVVNASCTTYTFTEELSSTGVCQFTATFVENFENIFPSAVLGSSAYVLALTALIAPVLISFISTQFAVKYKRNIPDVATKLTKLTISLNNFGNPVNTSDNLLNIFKTNSTDLENNKYTLIQSPSDLGNSISDLMSSFNDISLTPEDGYKFNSNNYKYGNDDVYINPTTSELIERINNRKALNSSINTFLLMNLYNNAMLITYLDDEQLNLIANDLEDKYQYLILNNNLTDDILYQLEILRDEVRKFFDTVRVNINKVITTTIKAMPLSILLYTYYENFDNESEILSLNNILDPTKIEGEIKILSS